jgi:hypothetical protein
MSNLSAQFERDTVAFDDGPVAYFSKRKDGNGHHFLCLVYAGVPGAPFFNPRELRR